MLFRNQHYTLEDIAFLAKEIGINLQNQQETDICIEIDPNSRALRKAIRIITDFENIFGAYFGFAFLGETEMIISNDYIEIRYENAIRKLNHLKPGFFKRLSDQQLNHITEKSVDYLKSNYGICSLAYAD